jgi:hypothetical protein
MEKKINLVELLKDCPKGMELDCTMFENVSFRGIQNGTSQIMIHTPDGIKFFNSYGCYHDAYSAKCVIFPKGKTTWEGFHRPFKDGDIISNCYCDAICIFKGEGNLKGTVDFYCGIDGSDGLLIKDVKDQDEHFGYINEYYFATEEEKQKLFDAIKEYGYKWNGETKTLEKLLVPKFKVGDIITKRDSITNSWTVSRVSSEYYGLQLPKGSEGIGVLPVCEQDEWELVPDKFDINTLKPFDKVLVRGDVGQRWIIDFFGFMDNKKGYPFVCVGHYVIQCIPYEGNERLLGTTDDCDEYYKTWE